jgi:hypothetical protein
MPHDAKPPRCPKCSSEKVAEIIYRMVASDPEIEKQVGTGKIILAGCVVPKDPRRWQCVVCRHKWGRPDFEKIFELRLTFSNSGFSF